MKTRILYLVNRDYFEKKMSRGARFVCPKFVGNHPDVDFRVSGQNWQDWDGLQSCTENFARWGWMPDWIWAYKPEDHNGVAKSLPLKLVTYNETHWDDHKALREVESMRADLVVVHHQGGLKDFDGFAGQVIHIPHAADHTIFNTPHDAQRPIDCLLTGVISDEIYPIRGRLKRLIESGKIPGEIRKHPGYRLASAGACNIQVQDYANHLGRAKIALCCTSKYRYALAKIFESALAGCCVATDMPDDSVFEKTLGQHIIELDGSWTDSQIAQCIQSHLADPVALRERARATQQCALEHFTMDCYAGKLLSAMKNAQKEIVA